MDSRAISSTLITACGLWALSVALFAVAAFVYGLHGGRLPILIAEGACIVSAAAATVHVKYFAERVCGTLQDRDALAADIRQLRSTR